MVEERKDKREDDKKPKKESDLKKFLNKRSFIYLSAAVFFVVFFVPDMIAPGDMERIITDDCGKGTAPLHPSVLSADEEIVACDMVKSYRGVDDDGANLFDVIILQNEKAFDSSKVNHGEKFLEHNETTIRISAWLERTLVGNSCSPYLRCHDGYNYSDGVYNVIILVNTYAYEAQQYLWLVDVKTGEISPDNKNAKKMMDIVDFYD